MDELRGLPGENILRGVVDEVRRDGNIVLAVFKYGSHLYGTNTEGSDYDYHVLFFPPMKNLLAGGKGSYRRSTGNSGEKNAPGDIDVQASDIRDVLRRFGRGEMVAIDLVYALTNEDATIYAHPAYREWWLRTVGRLGFGDLAGVLGYMNNQASKYGLKGTRLGTAIRLAESLRSFLDPNPSASILDWVQEVGEDGVFTEPFVQRVSLIKIIKGGKREPAAGIDAFGKKFTLDAPAQSLLDALERMIKKYGHRAKTAMDNEGVDWKALSHAYRAGVEYLSLRKRGFVRFPLPPDELETIKAIKAGRLDFPEAAALVEEKIEAVAELRGTTTRRLQIDHGEALLNLFTLLAYGGELFGDRLAVAEGNFYQHEACHLCGGGDSECPACNGTGVVVAKIPIGRILGRETSWNT